MGDGGRLVRIMGGVQGQGGRAEGQGRLFLRVCGGRRGCGQRVVLGVGESPWVFDGRTANHGAAEGGIFFYITFRGSGF